MTDLWADLDGLSRKPGPTMTITKGQFGALLNEIAALRAELIRAGRIIHIANEHEGSWQGCAWGVCRSFDDLLRAALATAKEAER